MSYTRLKLKNLSKIVGSDELVLILLVDENEQRQLVVPCDTNIGRQLLARMENRPHPLSKSMLPDVLVDMLYPTLAHCHFRISDLVEGKYLSHIYNTQTDTYKEIRCSDGILLSLIADMPMYIEDSLMKRQAVPYRDNMVQMPLPINVISNKLLEQSLQRAIECEDYEMASNIRDELKRRKEEKKDSNGL